MTGARDRARRALRGVALLASLLAIGAALFELVGAPPVLVGTLARAGDLGADPVEVVLAALTLLAELTAAYLVMLVGLAVAGQLPGLLGELAGRVLRSIGPPVVRRAVEAALGGVLAVGLLAGPVAVGASAEARSAPTGGAVAAGVQSAAAAVITGVAGANGPAPGPPGGAPATTLPSPTATGATWAASATAADDGSARTTPIPRSAPTGSGRAGPASTPNGPGSTPMSPGSTSGGPPSPATGPAGAATGPAGTAAGPAGTAGRAGATVGPDGAAGPGGAAAGQAGTATGQAGVAPGAASGAAPGAGAEGRPRSAAPSPVASGRSAAPSGPGSDLPTTDAPPSWSGTSQADDRGAGVIHVVRPGDTLWGIASAQLPAAQRTNAAIAAQWQRIYAANQAAIGEDPDLILPGTPLALPTPAAGVDQPD